jgi:exopolysaccharide biosynthesis protein
VGEVLQIYSRAGIGIVDDLHYLYMSLNHGSQEARWTVTEFARHFAEKPVQTAYCLDGGQTGEVYFCGSVYNYIDFGVERRVSDILYFATAVPSAEEPGA